MYLAANATRALPLVHPHETNVDFLKHDPHPIRSDQADDLIPVTLRSLDLSLTGRRTSLHSAENFRHSGWAPVRRRVYDALKDCCIPTSRLERFVHCGTQAWIVAHKRDPRTLRIVGNYCRDRFCTPCANARSRFIADQLLEVVTNSRVRFLTLTIKTGDKPLVHYLEKLRTSFRRLRQIKLWSKCVKGGIAMMETKWNAETQRWHPHYHILFTGRFLPLKALRNAWLKATGDSYIIDIQEVKSPTKATQYVAKYATKGIDNNTLRNPDRLREAITALRGKRTLLLLGDWRRISLRPARLSDEWDHIVSLTRLLELIRDGNDYAINVFHSLLTHQRLTDRLPIPHTSIQARSPPQTTTATPTNTQPTLGLQPSNTLAFSR